MPPSPPVAPPPASPKRSFFDDFRGRTWWELVLILLPVGLLPIGGLLGGACGGAGLVVNLWLAKKSFPLATKVFAMIGVVLASYLIFFALVTILYVAMHRGQ
jgi:hypothetical protein